MMKQSLIINLLWFIRGVNALNFRKICTRCNQTGQAHFPYSKCIRMK